MKSIWEARGGIGGLGDPPWPGEGGDSKGLLGSA